MVMVVPCRLRARGGRPAAAAALLALGALLMLLGTRPLPPAAPPTRTAPPASSGAFPPTAPAPSATTKTRVAAAKLTASAMLVNSTEEPLEAGAVLVRARYVAGWARAHAELCPARGARLRLLVLVTSAPRNSAARAAVRLTWAAAARRADVAFAFVLGSAPPDLEARLDEEDALYGDLIEGRFVDSYLNLTLKTLSILDWAGEHCPLAPRLLKTDDDMFINVDGVLRFAEAPARRAAGAVVWGKVWRNGRPVRDRRSKFFVPREEFPGARYPPYANGPAYLMTREAARRLRRASGAARWLRMEDVLVTGVLAAAAHVALVDAPAFLAPTRRVANPCALRRALAVHQVRYHEQFDLWRKLLDGKAKCPP